MQCYREIGQYSSRGFSKWRLIDRQIDIKSLCIYQRFSCMLRRVWELNQAYSFELWTVFLENLGVAETSLETIRKAFLSLPIDCLIVGRVAVFGVTGRVFLEVDLMELSFFSNVNVSSRLSWKFLVHFWSVKKLYINWHVQKSYGSFSNELPYV